MGREGERSGEGGGEEMHPLRYTAARRALCAVRIVSPMVVASRSQLWGSLKKRANAVGN